MTQATAPPRAPAGARPDPKAGTVPPVRRFGLPGGLLTSALAAVTCWLSLLSWRGMVDSPGRVVWPLALVAAVVAALGWGVRRLRPGIWPAVVLQVLVVAWWLMHRASGSWLPSPSALGELFQRLAQGISVAQRYASPVSTDHAQFHFLLIAGGAAILIAFDLVCCGLRRPTIAGLALLLAITISASVLLAGVGMLLFLLVALGWLTLVAAQESEHTGSWGRGNGSSNFGSVAWLSTRIALTCGLIAVLLSGTLSSQGRTFGNFGQGDGGTSLNVGNPILDLRRNLVQGKDIPLVDVRTSGPAPEYLQTTVLDQFTGSAWQPSSRDLDNTTPVGSTLPRPPGMSSAALATAPTHEWQITVDKAFPSRWLPLPFPALSVNVDNDWRYDDDTLDVFGSNGVTAAGMSYNAVALSPVIDPEALRAALPPPAALRSKMTALPDGLPQVFRTTAERVTASARNDFDRAVLLQRWFRDDGGFRYSLKPAAGSGIATLRSFITTDRVGYCEQFAAAMAVMARTLHIPARIGVGFLRAEKTGNDFVFSSHDLHAWPELFFQGVGWIRFEPTPQARTAAPPSYTTQVTQETPTSVPTSTSTATTPQQNLKPRPAHEPNNGASTASGSHPGYLLPIGVLLVVAALVALLAPRVVRVRGARRRWARARSPEALADAAWTEIRATALDLDLGWSDTATVRSNGRTVQRDVAPTLEARDALREVVRFVELTRYARPRALSAEQRDLVRDGVATWREAVLRSVGPKRARRARWWPRSVTRSALPSVQAWLRNRVAWLRS